MNTNLRVWEQKPVWIGPRINDVADVLMRLDEEDGWIMHPKLVPWIERIRNTPNTAGHGRYELIEEYHTYLRMFKLEIFSELAAKERC